MSQAWNHVFLNGRHNSFQAKGRLVRMWTKMAANLNDIKTSKKITFYPNRIFLSQKFIGWYIESDKKIKNFDDMGTLTISYYYNKHLKEYSFIEGNLDITELILSFYPPSRKSVWENLQCRQNKFQPIKFVNSVVPSPCETQL